MIAEKMKPFVQNNSAIRMMFEEGNRLREKYGADKVYDFSLGNPNVPAPEEVHQVFKELLDTRDDVYLFGYTSAQGDLEVRKAIADDLNRRFQTNFRPDNFYMTCGAAASLRITLEAMTVPGDEYIIFTPYFPEYKVFVEAAGGRFVPAATNGETFQIDFDRLEAAVNEHTKGIFVNSPNNPSGVVFTEESILRLAAFLESKEKEYGHTIYLIADEPYRELVYGDVFVPYLTKYYRDTVVCYSYSKSLSMPGERIGYILVPDEAADAGDLYAAVCGAGRALGYVCAPSMAQHVIARCQGMVSDLSVYRKNRDLLYEALESYGYTCVHPDGAFYLFVRALEPDAVAFCEKAKEQELLLVPADDFGCPGYVRIAYCVTTEQIQRALPAFRKLAESYGVEKK